MLTQLTEAQLEASAAAEADGQTFANVTPAQLFGPNADGVLAQRIYRAHPARYLALKQEHLYAIGAERRPDEYWHGGGK